MHSPAMGKSGRTIFSLFVIVGVVACGSTPHIIELRDGRVLRSVDEPEYQQKTGYFRYVDKDDRDAMVRASEVVQIIEVED